jgi:ABC-2 type transport system ATP-binding protein
MFAIETEKLTKKYGARNVVEDVSFVVEEGTVFGFLGPNGAGKTTTIRMLLGLVRPTFGTARILGMDIRSDFAKIVSFVGAVVENPTFFPGLTAVQTLKTFADYSGLKKSDCDLRSLLDTCGILHAAEQKVESFSLGMKQRLGLAAALMNDPRIVFLDEPTNGLDPQGIRKTRKLIRALAERQGRTVFLSSHLLSEVEQVCDGIAILVNGRIKATGKVSELIAENRVCLMASPALQAVEALSRSFPMVKIETTAVPNEILIDIDTNEIPTVVKILSEAGISIYEIRKLTSSLEGLFHRVTELA